MSRMTRMSGLVLACMLVPVVASAQEQPAQVQAWRAELQTIEMQLSAAQREALEDETLAAEQAEVTEAVRGAMIAADPGIEAQLTRLGELVTQARAAQAAGDAERIASLTVEAQELQPVVAAAQARALQVPEIAARVEAFQGRLHARMAEIDPEAQGLLTRRDELVRLIREAEGE